MNVDDYCLCDFQRVLMGVNADNGQSTRRAGSLSAYRTSAAVLCAVMSNPIRSRLLYEVKVVRGHAMDYLLYSDEENAGTAYRRST